MNSQLIWKKNWPVIKIKYGRLIGALSINAFLIWFLWGLPVYCMLLVYTKINFSPLLWVYLIFGVNFNKISVAKAAYLLSPANFMVYMKGPDTSYIYLTFVGAIPLWAILISVTLQTIYMSR
ncbi:MAG: hypothetical protein ACP5MW_06375, partial [Thermoplasmata archaeon]